MGVCLTRDNDFTLTRRDRASKSLLIRYSGIVFHRRHPLLNTPTAFNAAVEGCVRPTQYGLVHLMFFLTRFQSHLHFFFFFFFNSCPAHVCAHCGIFLYHRGLHTMVKKKRKKKINTENLPKVLNYWGNF